MNIYKNNELIFNDARFSGPYGLMFKKKLKENQSIIMALEKEAQFGSSIHMFFVFYQIWQKRSKNTTKTNVTIRKHYRKTSACFILESTIN